VSRNRKSSGKRRRFRFHRFLEAAGRDAVEFGRIGIERADEREAAFD
jgi:hypothetical protein